MLENTALSMTYASNVGIIVACAPFFVAVMVGFFFKNEKSGLWFYIGFVIGVTRRIYFYGILFFDTGTAYTARILECGIVPGYGDCSQFPDSWIFR